MRLKGRRALVTGGSRGAGAAIVLGLAELGASVGVNYVRARDRAEQVASQAREHGVTAVPIQADVGIDADARRLVEETVDALGGLDILVNNAAITRFVNIPDLEGVTDDVWDDIFQTNVRGMFQVTRAAAPHLKESGDGVVVNIGSTAGFGNGGSSIPYCASKAVVHSMTKTLSRALAPTVRVNCVAPGWIDTEWHQQAVDQETHMARRGFVIKDALLGKVLQPEDVADAVIAFVAHNTMATSQILRLDGGRTG